MEVVAIAAVAENGVIGDAGELPWSSLPDDKRQYRMRVADSTVVLGRVTYQAMREDLPGKHRIVLTSRPHGIDLAPSDRAVSSATEALDRARERETNRLYVLGGGAAYASFMPHFDRLVISRVPGHFSGDTDFPRIDPSVWQKEQTQPRNGYELEIWRRHDDAS